MLGIDGGLKQTKENSKAHMASREAAKEAMAEATQIRKKENTAYNQQFALLSKNNDFFVFRNIKRSDVSRG